MSLFGCLLRFAFRVSIGAKILGIGVGIALLFGVTILVVARTEVTRKILSDLTASGCALAEDLSSFGQDLIAAGDTARLAELLTDAERRHDQLLYAAAVDGSGRVIAEALGTRVAGSSLEAVQPPPGKTIARQLESGGETTLDIAAPLAGGEAGHIRIGLSTREVGESVQRTTLAILGTLGACAAVGLVFAVLLTRTITRPIQKLVETTDRVGRGDLAVEAPVVHEDEIGSLSRSLNDMIGRLRHYRAEVERKEASRKGLLEKIITAQEDERKRVARELHDGAGQALTSILIRLRLLIDATPEGPTQAALEDLRQQVSETLEEIRTVAVELRPSVLDDHGIVPALQKYVADFGARTGVSTDFQAIGFDSVEEMAPPLKSALYRIAQEALTNVARHAKADQASVVLQRAGGRVRLHVEDSGVGFDVDQAFQRDERGHHVGLLGMQERAALIDGTLTVESRQGDGTALCFEAPWLGVGEPA